MPCHLSHPDTATAHSHPPMLSEYTTTPVVFPNSMSERPVTIAYYMGCLIPVIPEIKWQHVVPPPPTPDMADFI